MENTITITTFSNQKIIEPYGEEIRCDNCGIQISKAKHVITGGMLTDGEWACCNECSTEMSQKGCCFEELGNGVYRKQKY